MIKPTVGRVILISRKNKPAHQPECGLITYVHSDNLINVAGFDANGDPFQITGLALVQDGEESPVYDHAYWMPYQVGQAAKTEALAKELADRDAKDV